MSAFKFLCLFGALCTFVALITPAWGVVANEDCRFNQTLVGICLPARDCQSYRKGSLDRTVLCGDGPLVCCPPRNPFGQPEWQTTIDDKRGGAVALQWCRVYTTACTTRNHAESQNSGVNELAEPNEFPHMAVVGYGERELITWDCGGTLISEKYVLTAARCLQRNIISGTNTRQLPAAWVRLGVVKTRNYFRDGEIEGQTHPVIRRIRHPGFKDSSRYFDVALLMIGSPLKDNALPLIGKSIHPACLEVEVDKISEAVVTGWGYGNEDTLYLQKLRTNTIDNDQCNQTFRQATSGSRKPPRGIDETKMCAKSICTKGEEAGGSLQVIKDNESCQQKIMGVTSFAACDRYRNNFAVYSLVPYYLKWIEEEVWGEREPCYLSEGHIGECKSVKDCRQHAQLLINEGKTQEIKHCGFEKDGPLVCCPLSTEEKKTDSMVSSISSTSQQHTESVLPGEKAVQACKKFKSICLPKSDDDHLYPHLAMIGYGEMEDIHWGCGGTLISENHVLMAAHCINDSTGKTASFVRLGSHFGETCCRKSSNGEVIGQIHPILNIIRHPEYDGNKLLNDIAVLKIGEAVEPGSFSTLSSSIHPACLQTSKLQETAAIGIGVSDLGLEDGSELNYQSARFQLPGDSEGNVKSISGRFNCKESDSPSCIQDTQQRVSKCQTRSEGPLLVQNQDRSCQHNVVAFLTRGHFCSSSSQFFIYTKILPYLKWIEDIVWP